MKFDAVAEHLNVHQSHYMAATMHIRGMVYSFVQPAAQSIAFIAAASNQKTFSG